MCISIMYVLRSFQLMNDNKDSLLPKKQPENVTFIYQKLGHKTKDYKIEPRLSYKSKNKMN